MNFLKNDIVAGAAQAGQWAGDKISKGYDNIKGAVQANITKDNWLKGG